MGKQRLCMALYESSNLFWSTLIIKDRDAGQPVAVLGETHNLDFGEGATPSSATSACWCTLRAGACTTGSLSKADYLVRAAGFIPVCWMASHHREHNIRLWANGRSFALEAQDRGSIPRSLTVTVTEHGYCA